MKKSDDKPVTTTDFLRQIYSLQMKLPRHSSLYRSSVWDAAFSILNEDLVCVQPRSSPIRIYSPYVQGRQIIGSPLAYKSPIRVFTRTPSPDNFEETNSPRDKISNGTWILIE